MLRREVRGETISKGKICLSLLCLLVFLSVQPGLAEGVSPSHSSNDGPVSQATAITIPPREDVATLGALFCGEPSPKSPALPSLPTAPPKEGYGNQVKMKTLVHNMEEFPRCDLLPFIPQPKEVARSGSGCETVMPGAELHYPLAD